MPKTVYTHIRQLPTRFIYTICRREIKGKELLARGTSGLNHSILFAPFRWIYSGHHLKTRQLLIKLTVPKINVDRSTQQVTVVGEIAPFPPCKPLATRLRPRFHARHSQPADLILVLPERRLVLTESIIA